MGGTRGGEQRLKDSVLVRGATVCGIRAGISRAAVGTVKSGECAGARRAAPGGATTDSAACGGAGGSRTETRKRYGETQWDKRDRRGGCSEGGCCAAFGGARGGGAKNQV